MEAIRIPEEPGACSKPAEQFPFPVVVSPLTQNSPPVEPEELVELFQEIFSFGRQPVDQRGAQFFKLLVGEQA